MLYVAAAHAAAAERLDRASRGCVRAQRATVSIHGRRACGPQEGSVGVALLRSPHSRTVFPVAAGGGVTGSPGRGGKREFDGGFKGGSSGLEAHDGFGWSLQPWSFYFFPLRLFSMSVAGSGSEAASGIDRDCLSGNGQRSLKPGVFL